MRDRYRRSEKCLRGGAPLKNIVNDIKEKNLKQVYLLYGEETYLIQQCKKELQKAILEGDTMNLYTHSGEKLALLPVREFANTMPFFAKKRLVILEDTKLCKNASEDGWVEFIHTVPDTAHLIIVEKEVDKRNKVYKEIVKSGYVANFEKSTPAMLTKWIVNRLAKEHIRITQNAVEIFLERTENDMLNIQNELEKLINYVGEKKEIHPEDVEKMTSAKLENRVYLMIDALARKSKEETLKLYYDLLEQKTPYKILITMIMRHLNQLLFVKEFASNGVRGKEMASKIGIAPFLAGKYEAQAKLFSAKKLRTYIEKCTEVDERFMIGELNEILAIESVMLAILYE